MTKTNKLIRSYDGCDGGKTGFTNEAGFCLAATAKRQNLRVISVVIGEQTSAKRFEDVRTMFDYAFASYQATPVLEAGAPLQEKASVNGGREKQLSVYANEGLYALTKRGEKGNYSTTVRFDTLSAPVRKDEKVGDILLFKDGTEIQRLTLYAGEDVEKANFWDRLKEIAEKWN